jgi:hypothetical protein
LDAVYPKNLETFARCFTLLVELSGEEAKLKQTIAELREEQARLKREML